MAKKAAKKVVNLKVASAKVNKAMGGTVAQALTVPAAKLPANAFIVGKPLMTAAEAKALMTGPAPATAQEAVDRMKAATLGPDTGKNIPNVHTEADMAKGKKTAKAPKAGKVIKVKGSEKLEQPKPGVAAKKADKPAPVPCSKCGRQNPQNADCRIPSACQRRVRKAKEAAKAAAAPAAPKPATAKEASL